MLWCLALKMHVEFTYINNTEQNDLESMQEKMKLLDMRWMSYKKDRGQENT